MQSLIVLLVTSLSGAPENFHPGGLVSSDIGEPSG
jgi:hypothetical protein